MTNNSLQNILGWIGVLAILGAYALTNFEILGLKSPAYLGLNLFGSIAIITGSLPKKDYQPVVLNVVWAIVALVGILSLV